MKWLAPKLPWRLVPRMLGMAGVGALISGVYGICHDQLTYTLSPEYFTRFKSEQFRYADFGFPERIFVAEIGFLATWWVGFFVGWFLAGIAVPAWPAKVAWKKVELGFAFVGMLSLAAGVVGYFVSPAKDEIRNYWVEMCGELGVVDITAFTTVGYIHTAGYLGGLIGVVMVAIALMRQERCENFMR